MKYEIEWELGLVPLIAVGLITLGLIMLILGVITWAITELQELRRK